MARLAGALGLLEDDRVAGRVPDGRARRDEARPVSVRGAPGREHHAPARPAVAGPVGPHRRLQAYEANNDPKNQPRINAVLRAASALHDRLEETRWKVGDAIDYPFEHAQEDVTLGKFAFPPLIPAKDDIGGLLDAALEAINRLAGLHRRALGRLALAAEEVERALGLPPIEVEEPDKEAAG